MSLVIEGSCNDGKELRGDDFSEIDSFVIVAVLKWMCWF